MTYVQKSRFFPLLTDNTYMLSAQFRCEGVTFSSENSHPTFQCLPFYIGLLTWAVFGMENMFGGYGS
jgi:hypothetical protein